MSVIPHSIATSAPAALSAEAATTGVRGDNEMTMPKFEPITKMLVLDEAERELVFNLQKPLHTADQLTEAYEAGKRAASLIGRLCAGAEGADRRNAPRSLVKNR